MGIQRFTQDLSLYTEAAVLGDTHGDGDHVVSITNLIVDGPSLAYHVYNKLLAYRLLASGKDDPPPPTYLEIGNGAASLLSDIAANMVEISAIFFDGSLPKSKQGTRLARLEGTRKQLDECRRLHPEPPWSVSTVHSVDHDQALWSQAPLATRRRFPPPPPPFLVPAVIEAIQQSPWKHVLQVVPEEADVACARRAQSSGATILSNDSDMCIYDLGNDACVVQLHTLEKHHPKPDRSSFVIRGLCIRPLALATRLRVPSLLRLAYERLSDGSASFNVILATARTTQAPSERSKFEQFAADYAVPQPTLLESPLQSLDPRVAEFVVEVSCSTATATASPNVYLPMLYEDPQRDASWSYGLALRQLAYSIHVASHQGSTRQVMEYSRKGARITSTEVPILQRSDLHQRIMSTCDSLDGRSAAITDQTDAMISWYVIALLFVIRQRLDQGKSVLYADIMALFGLSNGHQAITWPNVHLHACAEAFLYSLRMLKQLTDLALKLPCPQETELRSIQRLAAALREMPHVAGLFAPIAQVRESYQRCALHQDEDVLGPIWTLLPDPRESASKKSQPGHQQSTVTSAGDHPAKRAKTTAGTRGASASASAVAAHNNPFDILSDIT